MSLTQTLSPVAPCHPVAGYIGGKRRLAATLCRRIASLPHRTYAEAFVGMGQEIGSGNEFRI